MYEIINENNKLRAFFDVDGEKECCFQNFEKEIKKVFGEDINMAISGSIAEKNGINFYCGSELNKFKRWQGACERFDVDFFVTADGDDLLCEPELIDLAFVQYERNNTDFINLIKSFHRIKS